MMDYKWYGTIIAVLLMVLIGSTAGCITIVKPGPAAPPTSAPQEPTAPPVINSFTTSPADISPAQRTTLSWDVSGANTIAIQPDIGSVGPSGSLQLSPPATVTYTLTAANQAGSNTASVTVIVTPVADKPDLVITDIWMETVTIYYKIKNQGTADAKPSWSELQVVERKEATNYVDSLAAGEERTSSFSNWEWPFQLAFPGLSEEEVQHYTIKVCADIENAVDEFDEGNNCTTERTGAGYTYDFVKQAHLAKWKSSAGDLKWPMVAGDKKGAASLMADTIVICPEQVSNGWILARFADYYADEGGLTRSREIEVPRLAKFTAKVGFGPTTTSTDGVMVAFGYVDATGSVVLLQKMDVYSDGSLRLYEVDLSGMAGQKTEFILWVEAKDSPEGDCVRWVAPKIVQGG